MVTKSNKRKRRKSRVPAQAVLGKPTGVIQPRVQEVGPERFGIVAVDCAKARSKWMLCNFYGEVLLPPAEVQHTRASLQLATVQLDEARRRHHLGDLIVCIEMTGTYHRPVWRSFGKAGYETRLVHPFASNHYRLAEHGDLKTDDHDLEGIFRAAINGFGLVERPWDEVYQTLQLFARHRRDLVNKRAKLQCQIRQYLERALPGYADLFPDDNLWSHAIGLSVARFAAQHGGTAEAITNAGLTHITKWLREQRVRFQSRTLERIIAWAAGADAGDPMSTVLARIWQTLIDDWQAKTGQIQRLERDLAGQLVQTPYLLLLSHPGINVVSGAELAGEMGPIEYYAHARAITGRAGLFPSRYQSDEVDRGGCLSRFRNARLRAAWLRVADNLVKCNAHWRGKFQFWKSQGVDSRDLRCRVANRVTRTVFAMVYGRRLYDHPSRLDRMYVMDKLLTFHQDRKTPPHEIVRDLEQAAKQIPQEAYAAEAKPIQEVYQRSMRSRRREPQQIGTLLVAVLARLGVTDLQSTEAQGPDAPSDARTR